ncbi:chitin synthase regulatory factor 3 [Helicobacter pylori]|nr:chitin synthase regulatory factor 3 [Helicobacter pylori]
MFKDFYRTTFSFLKPLLLLLGLLLPFSLCIADGYISIVLLGMNTREIIRHIILKMV